MIGQVSGPTALNAHVTPDGGEIDRLAGVVSESLDARRLAQIVGL